MEDESGREDAAAQLPFRDVQALEWQPSRPRTQSTVDDEAAEDGDDGFDTDAFDSDASPIDEQRIIDLHEAIAQSERDEGDSSPSEGSPSPPLVLDGAGAGEERASRRADRRHFTTPSWSSEMSSALPPLSSIAPNRETRQMREQSPEDGSSRSAPFSTGQMSSAEALEASRDYGAPPRESPPTPRLAPTRLPRYVPEQAPASPTAGSSLRAAYPTESFVMDSVENPRPLPSPRPPQMERFDHFSYGSSAAFPPPNPLVALPGGSQRDTARDIHGTWTEPNALVALPGGSQRDIPRDSRDRWTESLGSGSRPSTGVSNQFRDLNRLPWPVEPATEYPAAANTFGRTSTDAEILDRLNVPQSWRGKSSNVSSSASITNVPLEWIAEEFEPGESLGEDVVEPGEIVESADDNDNDNDKHEDDGIDVASITTTEAREFLQSKFDMKKAREEAQKQMMEGRAEGNYTKGFKQIAENLIESDIDDPSRRELYLGAKRAKNSRGNKTWRDKEIALHQLATSNPSHWMNETWGPPIKNSNGEVVDYPWRPEENLALYDSVHRGTGPNLQFEGIIDAARFIGADLTHVVPKRRRSSTSPQRAANEEAPGSPPGATQQSSQGNMPKRLRLELNPAGPAEPRVYENEEDERRCDWCRRSIPASNEGTFCCPNCFRRTYCSIECQKLHANDHRERCKAPVTYSLTIRNKNGEDNEADTQDEKGVRDEMGSSQKTAGLQLGPGPERFSDAEADLNMSYGDEGRKEYIVDYRISNGRILEYLIRDEGQEPATEMYVAALDLKGFDWTTKMREFWILDELILTHRNILEQGGVGRTKERPSLGKFIWRARFARERVIQLDVREYSEDRAADKAPQWARADALGVEWDDAIDRYWSLCRDAIEEVQK